MKKAAIVMDNYKAELFRKNLKSVGFEWEEAGQLTGNALVFTVKYTDDNFQKLANIVKISNDLSRGSN